MNTRNGAADSTRRFELREIPRAADGPEVRRLLESTGFFRADEVAIAVELVDEHLARGSVCGYKFIFADHVAEPGRLAGFTCYGEIACTIGSFDLYWIGVDDVLRGAGLGRWLLDETEARIRALGGRRVYAETSGRPSYAPTQGFYDRRGYRLEATLEDFYEPGDPKVVFVKVL